MKISDYLTDGQIILRLTASAKEEIIKELIYTLKDNPRVKDLVLFLRDTLQREKFSTTGIGHGIAIPHARTDAVSDILISLGRAPEGVDFDSLDSKPVKLVFLLGTPKREKLSNYLSVLARLTRLLEKESFRNDLLEAATVSDIIETFRRSEI